jgi:hypothetical protein
VHSGPLRSLDDEDDGAELAAVGRGQKLMRESQHRLGYF